MRACPIPLLVLTLLGTPAVAIAEEGGTVERGDVRSTIEVSGTFVPGRCRTVIPYPAAWSGRYEVAVCREPGTLVKAGEVVLRFDDRRIRDAVEAAKRDLEHARVGAEIARERRELAESALKEDLERKEHELANATRRHEAYRDHSMPHAATRAKLDEDSVRFGLENAREELRQLEMMYAEDELVDETEKIVLARARWDVEKKERELAQRIQRRAIAVKFEEQPHLESLEREAARRRSLLARARSEAGLARRARAVEETRERDGLDLKMRHHLRLVADLEGHQVRAPVDGVMLHGRPEGSLGRRYSVGQALSPTGPVISVVERGGVMAALRVPVADRLRIEPRQAVMLKPSAAGAEDIAGRVATIEGFPSDGHLRVLVASGARADPLLLGVPVSGTVVVEEALDVLVVPTDRVVREDGSVFLLVVGKEGEDPRRVAVELGLEGDGLVEVRSGVQEGDRIAKPSPKGTR